MISLCVAGESGLAIIGPALESNCKGLIRAKQRDSVGGSYGRDAARVRVDARRNMHGHFKRGRVFSARVTEGKKLTLIDRMRRYTRWIRSALGTTRSNGEDGNVRQ